ncbi:hypothetical protein PIB30_111385 [Stylosanthes scabra]|uniref:Transglycosylase SLT domain-containing protein n=1 Tax=Stylosanthes scabra TaxID=79078 RepID=A0ABU6T0G8_9FABA|nr:hypothetical protein [Stylosanthes scabra]
MALTSTFAKKLSTGLTIRVRSSRAGEPARVSSKARRLSLGAALCLMGISMQTMPLNAATNTDHLKLYLHSKLISEKQYKCALYVVHTESRWNVNAINGTHHGLFQMNNKRVKYMNGYQQIDMWHRYIQHRYHGKACVAMSHLKMKGWQ